jgi:hypothetical protein
MRADQAIRHFLGPVELIHAQAGPRLLRLARIGIFALWIVKLLLDPIWRLALLPRELYLPTGILSWLSPSAADTLFTSYGLAALWACTLGVLVIALTNIAFPIVATAAAIVLSAWSSVDRAFGPAVHTDIALLLAVYALAGVAWADWLATKFGHAKPKQSWSAYPLVTIVAMLTLTYCLVGLNRTVAGGISVFTGNTMEVWAIDASLRGYYFNTNVGWHLPEWPWAVFMLRGGLPVVTFFEITAPLCLALPRYRWIFIPFMLSFHLLSLVFMNIFFFDDMLLYLLLVDWSRKFPALRSKP